MKATGITRYLEPLGRVVLPVELRRTLDIEVGDQIEIEHQGDRVIFKKYNSGEVANVRKLDSVGRIVIPVSMRTNLGLQAGMSVEFFVDGDAIVIKKYQAHGACAVTGEILAENRTYAGVTLSLAGKRELLSAMGIVDGQ